MMLVLIIVSLISSSKPQIQEFIELQMQTAALVPANYVNPEKTLLAQLFQNYDRNARPIVNARDTVDIAALFILGRIEELDEKKQKMSAYGWLPLYWFDPSLRWLPSDYGNVTQISVVSTRIWMPEISLINGATDTGDLGLKDNTFRVTVAYTGLVNFQPNMKWITSCKVNLVKFPFDSQLCYVNVTSFIYTIDRVKFNMISENVLLEYFEENGEWKVTAANSSVFHIAVDTGLMGVIYAEIHLKRRPTFYVLNILLPSVTISIFSLFVFILPIESGERVSLGISVVISYSVITLMIGDSMPTNGEQLPLVFIFVTACMIVTSLCVMLSVVSMRVHYAKGPVPRHGLLRFLLFEVFGRLALVKPVKCSRIGIKETDSKDDRIDEDLNYHGERSHGGGIGGRDLNNARAVGGVGDGVRRSKNKNNSSIAEFHHSPRVSSPSATLTASAGAGTAAGTAEEPAQVNIDPVDLYQWSTASVILDRVFGAFTTLILASIFIWMVVKFYQ